MDERAVLAGQSYDERMSSAYDEGQRFVPESFHLWLDAFRRHARPGTPQCVLDLGCGTGVFEPALADTFGGPVLGVEPSQHMRAVAQRTRPHPQVTYLEGSAELIPAATGSCDLVLMYLVLQHVTDRSKAAEEIQRVMKPGGRLLVAGRFRGEPTPRAWSRYFPRADAIEQLSIPSHDDTKNMFEKAGLRFLAVERIQFEICGSVRDYVERVRLRTVSAFEHLTEEEFAAGLAQLEAEAHGGADPGPVLQEADLMVFEG